MANTLLLGCDEVHVVSFPKPVFRVSKPAPNVNILVPVAGPPGPAGSIENLSWASIPDKPSVFPPAPHTHTIPEVNGLTTSLNSTQDALDAFEDMTDMTLSFENALA